MLYSTFQNGILRWKRPIHKIRINSLSCLPIQEVRSVAIPCPRQQHHISDLLHQVIRPDV